MLDRHLSEVVCPKAFLYSTTQHTPVQLDIMKLGRELLLAVVVLFVPPSPFLSSPPLPPYHALPDKYNVGYGAGASAYAYFHNQEEEMNFQLVDFSKPQRMHRTKMKLAYVSQPPLYRWSCDGHMIVTWYAVTLSSLLM